MMQGSCMGYRSPVSFGLSGSSVCAWPDRQGSAAKPAAASSTDRRVSAGRAASGSCRLMSPALGLQLEPQTNRVRLVEATGIARIDRLVPEVVLGVAVQQIGRIKGQREPVQHFVARRQVEPWLRVRVDFTGLHAAARSRTHVKSRTPVVRHSEGRRTLLVNADDVVRPLRNILEL